MPDQFGNLVVLSHLRWDGVWQRPHHLISRLSRRAQRTAYVEEPRSRPDVLATRVRRVQSGEVDRLFLEVPGGGEWHSFEDHDSLVAELQPTAADGGPTVVWLYTPLALPLARRLRPDLLVYDVMDDLASFRDASPETSLRHRAAVAEADVVFTGGRSLHRLVTEQRKQRAPVFCFPSGVDAQHFAAVPSSRPHCQPVAGYVGVIDERLDLSLVAALAEHLPDWRIRMVGPVIKIDPTALPQASNIEYLGHRDYGALPGIMAAFDVALMPFALNAATRSISPTKTLEYLAAGLPVISTAIPDVVADCGEVVHVADDAGSFAKICRGVHMAGERSPSAAVRTMLRHRSWDAIAGAMADAIDEALRDAQEADAASA